jgi:4-hydroxy-tetrahydrodipicolinate synthase
MAVIQLNRKENKMKKGFYTALGTPLDKNGELIHDSFKKHIEDQISAGASGLLILGSMGMQSAITNSEYPKIIKAGVEAAGSKTAVFAGVMDNSVARVLDRIDSIKDCSLDGVVPTTPFYYKESPVLFRNFFLEIADKSKFPVYLYDLPVVTQNPLSTEDVRILMKHGNILGIKTANMVIAREITNDPQKPSYFNVLFSGLDVCDIAYKYGIEYYLDGMFSCTPNLTGKMNEALASKDHDKAGMMLDKILNLRALFIKHNVFASFTAAMNILGYEGRFHPDYHFDVTETAISEIKDYLVKHEMV